MIIKRKYSIPALIALLLVIAGIAAFLMFGKNDFRRYDEILDKGVLRVAVGYNSTDFFVNGDTTKGFQYEIVQVLCDSLYLQPEWTVQNSLEENIESLAAGKVDLLACNIPVTVELRERVLFLHDITQIPQVLVQRKKQHNEGVEPIRSQIELGGKTVYMPENSPNILRLSNLSDEIADTIYVREMSNYAAEQLLILVAHGDIDFTVCDLQTARQNAALLPELDIETAVSFVQMQAWAVNIQSEELKQRVDSFLVKFLKTKEYRDIYRRYFR